VTELALDNLVNAKHIIP